MPDEYGNFKSIALGGKAGETWERIFGRRDDSATQQPGPATMNQPFRPAS